jgi:hypothetical protein
LITSPESEYLLPPYAASVTFELRHRKDGGLPESGQSSASGLYVNALYGFAVPVPPSASSSSSSGGSDELTPSSRKKWTYHRHPIALRCPDATTTSDDDASSAANMADGWMARKQWQCPLESFKKYVLLTARSSATAAAASQRTTQSAQTRAGALVSSQTYSPDDGCCVRTPAFHALGCDSIAATTTTTHSAAGFDHMAGNAGTLVSVELESECVAFRQRCPATACPSGYVLDPANLACVAVSLPAAAATTTLQPRSDAQQTLHTVDVDNNDGVSLISPPVNSGGDAAVLPLPSVHPRGSSSRFSSALSHPLWLFLFCCSFLLIGFALGSWWTRRMGSRSLSGSRGKHAYAYAAGGGSGDEHEHEHEGEQHAGAHDSPLVAQDSQSLLTRFAGKRKTSPTVNVNGAGMA